MRHILVIADRESRPANALKRAVALARAGDSRITLVGFVHENLSSLDPETAEEVAETLLRKREGQMRALAAAHGPRVHCEVVWEKHVARWICARAAQIGADLVIKTGHRTENWHYTPTDWQLLRDCSTPVLIVPEKPWRARGVVLAAIDLGTRTPSKRALNHKVVRAARALADQLGCALHLAHAVPFSQPLRDLGVLDVRKLVSDARARGQSFVEGLQADGIDVDGMHVKAGAPEKVLASLAADTHAQLVVLGCTGRKALAGRLVGNTAERILRYVRADVLALKP